jgi:hypothetical protein
MAAPRCLEDERQILFGENPVAHPMIENWQTFAAGHQPGGLADFPRGLAFPMRGVPAFVIFSQMRSSDL